MGGFEQGYSRHNEEGIFRDYEAEANRLIESAKPWGLECIKFDNNFILNWKYYPEHKDVLDKISFGFCYKVIGFYETLKKVKEGDILLFTDSNHIVEQDPSVFYNVADEYNMCCWNHIWVEYLNMDWTRRDTFVNMKCDEEKYWYAPQMQCNIIAIKKCDVMMRFVNEWLSYSLDYKVMFGENKYPNFEGFQKHRHDQSIFSILRAKYEIPFLNRTGNVWMEYIIPETSYIDAKNPIDNSFRREEDKKENE
jgi:hypothetical protein